MNLKPFVAHGIAVLFILSESAFAQIRFTPDQPDDVLNPASDVGIPERIDDILLPEIQFIFDSVLDPQRLSLIDSVTTENLNDPRLNDATRSIIRNHIIAMQQVEIAIRFLQANREDIIAGKNQSFTSVFGTVGTKESMAVLSAAPLGGTASLQVAQGAQGASATLMFQQQGGAGSNNQANVKSQASPGDVLFIEDPAGGGAMPGLTTNTRTSGIVVRVLQVIGNDPASASASAGGAGNNNVMQQIILDPNFGSAVTTPTSFSNARVFRVLRFEEQFSSARYEKALAVFEAIRASLSGLDPAVSQAGGLQNALRRSISYNRGFRDINTVFMPGVAEYTPLNDVVVDFMNSRRVAPVANPVLLPTPTTSTSGRVIHGADRLVRQAGFSNSDSHAKIGNKFEQFHPLFNEFPLLWTEDNNLRQPVFEPNAPSFGTDEDRAFFFDQQKLFSEFEDTSQQFLGRAFLSETERHKSFYLDDDISSVGLQTQTVNRRLPDGNLLVVIVGQPETGESRADVPRGTLDANSKRTEFRKWQMIIESFAEYDEDFGATNLNGIQNNAFIGIAELFGGFAPGNASADDAGNYARFAGLIGNSSLKGIDFSRIEPLGKRGKAGFNPIVPVN